MPKPTPEIVADLAPTGVLRPSINLGNPVLAQGTEQEPAGVTVDLGREIAARLGVPVDFVVMRGARKSFETALSGRADICFLAIEPARAAEIAFTAPYVLIEGVYAVKADSPLTTVEAADSPGVRIGVREGSAYDLFLTRTLQQATLVRDPDWLDSLRAGQLEVAAGVREPMTEFVAAYPECRLIDGRFMEIRQAVGTPLTKRPDSVQFLHDTVEELKASGFVEDALRRSGQTAPVAPPA